MLFSVPDASAASTLMIIILMMITVELEYVCKEGHEGKIVHWRHNLLVERVLDFLRRR